MNAILFGFHVITLLEQELVISKYSYELGKARAIFKMFKEEKLDKHMQFMQDPKDDNKIILCVTAPAQNVGYHRAIEIVREYGKQRANERTEEVAAMLAS